jgi:GT2 family glycosyltransferase
MTSQEISTPEAVPKKGLHPITWLSDTINHAMLRYYWMVLGRFAQYSARPMRLERFPAATPAEWPSIAIVTPSYQQAAFLERTMRSVLEQKYSKLSYAVMDGGSKDGSADILTRYASQLAWHQSARDAGQADAVAQGFTKVSGDIMAWLNADDLLMPGALAFVGNYFATHPEVDVIYGHRVVIDEQDRETGRWVLPPHDYDFLRWSDYVPQETLFWRRSAFERAGGIDPKFQFALDWDFLLRLQESGAKIVRVPYFLGMFRVHAEQKTSACFNEKGVPEISFLRERTLGANFNRLELHQRVRKYRWQSVRTSLLLSCGIRE